MTVNSELKFQANYLQRLIAWRLQKCIPVSFYFHTASFWHCNKNVLGYLQIIQSIEYVKIYHRASKIVAINWEVFVFTQLTMGYYAKLILSPASEECGRKCFQSVHHWGVAGYPSQVPSLFPTLWSQVLSGGIPSVWSHVMIDTSTRKKTRKQSIPYL